MLESHSSPLCGSPTPHLSQYRSLVLEWDKLAAHTEHFPQCTHTDHSQPAKTHQAGQVTEQNHILDFLELNVNYENCLCDVAFYAFRLAMRSSTTWNNKKKSVSVSSVTHTKI